MFRLTEANIAKKLHPEDPRAFYIKKGAVKVADKLSDAVAYVSQKEAVINMKTAMRFYATIFYGKQTKPVANYYYNTAERRDKAVKEYFEGRQKSQAFKTAAREARKAWVPTYKVGDIFYTSWGYDQTNVEWFQIVEIKGKHAVLREIAGEYKATGWAMGNTTPLPGEFLKPRYEGDDRGAPIRRLMQEHGIKIDNVRTAWKAVPKMIGNVPVYGSHYTSSYA